MKLPDRSWKLGWIYISWSYIHTVENQFVIEILALIGTSSQICELQLILKDSDDSAKIQ